MCIMVLSIFVMIGMGAITAHAENIDPDNDDSQYAYGENVGYLNFEPGGNGGSGAEVTNSAVTGYVWGENIGWINLSPVSYGGVVNDGAGNLSGYAWGENVGWINFKPTGGGVTIGADGVFDGWAWGENIGWIHLKNLAIPYKVKTSWSPVQTNHPPVAADQSVTTDENTAVNITLTASDQDGDTLTFTVVSQPVNGTLSGNAPDVVYTPNTNFNGSDSFTFKANDGQLDSNVATVTITVNATNYPFNFDGFYTPVDNPPIMNVAKAGQTIPLKWHVADQNGNPVTDLTSVEVKATTLLCDTATTLDQIEEYAAGDSGLQNLGNGYYQFNWKTPKSYANSCKTLKLNLGDGVIHEALFHFKK